MAHRPRPGRPGTPDKEPPAPPGLGWRFLLILVFLLAVNATVVSLIGPAQKTQRVRIPYSPVFLTQVREGNVKSISSKELAEWLSELGEDVVVGIEGSGSFGAGLCELLLAEGICVVEVERPRREDRRRGKSDEIDALAAAKKVLAGEGLSTLRAGGARQALSALLVVYRSCVAERTRLLNQLQGLHTSAPIALRERIGPGNGKQLAARLKRMRSRADAPEAEQIIFGVLRDLARRTRELGAQAGVYERELTHLIESLDPTLLDEPGIGPISAAKLLASDPARLKGEAAFACCNGTAPKPASSGQTIRHRLDRGGDRQANNAIHTIALNRSLYDQRTRAYLERRTSEGKTKREAMRALKRHLSRSLYKRLITVPLTP